MVRVRRLRRDFVPDIEWNPDNGSALAIDIAPTDNHQRHLCRPPGGAFDPGDQALSTAPENRANNFDALRLLLALMVLYSHCFHLVVRAGNWVNPLEFTRGQTFLGGIAVDGFFVISGFLITASWQRSKGLVDYLRRRILRIYPGFVVAALVCLLVVGPWAAPTVAGYFSELGLVRRLIGVATLSKIENVPTFLGNPVPRDVNGSLWTIRLEFECYLLVPILGWLGFLRRRWWLVGAAMAAYLVHAVLVAAPGMVPGKLMRFDDHARFATYFLFGGVLHLFREQLAFPKWASWACVAVLGIAGQLGGFKLVEPFAWSWLLLSLAHVKTPWLSGLTRRADLSYGIYLYAWPVKQLLVWHFGPTLNPFLLFAMTTPITAALAAVSWFAVEKPFLKARAKRSSPAKPETEPNAPTPA